MHKFARAFFPSLLAALMSAPAVAAGCAAEKEALAETAIEPQGRVDETAARAAFARLEDFRASTFANPSFSGDYGIVGLFVTQGQHARDPRLCELYFRAARDQFARLAWMDVRLHRNWADGLNADAVSALEPALAAWLSRVDADNLLWLKADLKKNGWYKISTAGETADDAAWLLVQHATDDLDFQRQVLTMMEPLVRQGEANTSNYALLFDRVAVNAGRMQLYGSQGQCSGPHRWTPMPIDEPSEVDKRRAEAGLPPLADYIAGINANCP